MGALDALVLVHSPVSCPPPSDKGCPPPSDKGCPVDDGTGFVEASGLQDVQSGF